MVATLRLRTPEPFDLDLTVRSHGWYGLPPFSYSRESLELETVLACDGVLTAATLRPSSSGGVLLRLDPDPGPGGRTEARRIAARMLCLERDLTRFHELCRADPAFRWASQRGAGRLLRSPTVWEDLVKVICTTNCSWSLTGNMVGNLVNEAGPAGSEGRRSFPTAAHLARRPESWFREVVHAGYRSAYLRELAIRVASGELQPEAWDRPGADPALVERELRSVRGVGTYAAEQVLRLLGRSDVLALDSWCRSEYSKRYHRGRRIRDTTIRRRYASFGEWAGLAMWLDLTSRWHDPA